MADETIATEHFEANRSRLRGIAYRMLGSLAEAEDAVQETWLRYRRGTDIENPDAWLTTAVSRVCLNLLRARRTRREDPVEVPATAVDLDADPEREAVLADSVGLALLVLLDTLSPPERLAFVLHDMFAVPFDDIAPLVERSPDATRQLASRARRRVTAATPIPHAELNRQRPLVEAFLAAVRGADLPALVSLLAPEVTLHADRHVVPSTTEIRLSGVDVVAETAMAAAGRALTTGLVLVDGGVGLVMVEHGRLRLVLRFAVGEAGIVGIDVIADPDRLARLELGIVP